MTGEAAARQLVAEAGRMLLADGLAARTWGNVSCRTSEDGCVITPSGMGYENMSANDIVPLNMTSGEWQGARKPSSEKAIHIAAYRTFLDAGFVIHTHQTYASAFSLAGFDGLVLSDAEKNSLGGLALTGYGLPGTKKLARNVAEAFRSGAHIVLMAHHGAVVAGSDRAEAFARARLLEEICRRGVSGQPAVPATADEELARRLTDAVRQACGHACCTAAPAVLACAADPGAVIAQLDDMAQMIGPRLSVVPPDLDKILQTLQTLNAILVPGVGAVCRAADDNDCRALGLLAEKACVCWLHTRALGVSGHLSAFDTWLMRKIYLQKYSKKIGG